MGNPVENPFPVFYDAFPQELLDTFTKKTGHGCLGNEVASGTEIIARLGPEHLKTKKPIVYTSADSVFQIAAMPARKFSATIITYISGFRSFCHFYYPLENPFYAINIIKPSILSKYARLFSNAFNFSIV